MTNSEMGARAAPSPPLAVLLWLLRVFYISTFLQRSRLAALFHMKNDFSWSCANLRPDKEEEMERQRCCAEVKIWNTLIPLNCFPGALSWRRVRDEADDGFAEAKQSSEKEQKQNTA